jgi:hypothetical protein
VSDTVIKLIVSGSYLPSTTANCRSIRIISEWFVALVALVARLIFLAIILCVPRYFQGPHAFSSPPFATHTVRARPRPRLADTVISTKNNSNTSKISV